MGKDANRVDDDALDATLEDIDLDVENDDDDNDYEHDDNDRSRGGSMSLGVKLLIGALSLVAVVEIAVSVLFATGVIRLPAPSEGGATLG